MSSDLFCGREIIDISPTISAKLAVFPGDVAFRQSFSMHTDHGEHLTLSSIETSVHIGAHADAPIHYSPKAPGIESRDLNYYLGRTQVIEVLNLKSDRIKLKDIQHATIDTERVLFKTHSFPNPNKWTDDFVALSAELIEHLAQKNVKLVGIDTPSIDPAQDKELESHKAILRHNMAILEGIVLDKVVPGHYQLIALPLKIEGADASPVRAILLR